MRWPALLPGCFVVLICAASVQAATTFLAPVPISPQAIAADPLLADFQTWDLRVTVPAGQTWGFSGLEATLTQGSFYNSPLGGVAPQPQLWTIAPQLRFDTFVTQAADPDDDTTFIAPNVTSGFPEPPLPVVFTDTDISIVWHVRPGFNIGPGTFTVARLTISDDAVGVIQGHTALRPNLALEPFAFPVPIPEPATPLAVMLLVLPICARRRPTIP